MSAATTKKEEVAPPPIKFCEDLMRRSGIKLEAVSFVANCKVKATDPVDTQITAINRYWRRELGWVGPSTIDAREALLDGYSYSVWRQLFERIVLPVIVRNRLPQAHLPL